MPGDHDLFTVFHLIQELPQFVFRLEGADFPHGNTPG
jgi:hypothetical protein